MCVFERVSVSVSVCVRERDSERSVCEKEEEIVCVIEGDNESLRELV